MAALRSQGDEVPHHAGVRQVGLGIPLLGVDEVREFEGVPYKEDWSIIPDHIPISILSVKLDSKATGVTGSVSRSFLSPDSRKSGKNGSLLVDLFKHLGFGVFGDIMSDNKVSMSP